MMPSHETFDVLIEFADSKQKVIHEVTNYGYDSKTGVFHISKNGYSLFFNKDHIKYIGEKFNFY